MAKARAMAQAGGGGLSCGISSAASFMAELSYGYSQSAPGPASSHAKISCIKSLAFIGLVGNGQAKRSVAASCKAAQARCRWHHKATNRAIARARRHKRRMSVCSSPCDCSLFRLRDEPFNQHSRLNVIQAVRDAVVIENRTEPNAPGHKLLDALESLRSSWGLAGILQD